MSNLIDMLVPYKFLTFENILKTYNYDPILDIAYGDKLKIQIENIYNGAFNKKEKSKTKYLSGIVLCWLGNYNHDIMINFRMMKKYYILAIKKGNVDAMYRLGIFYKKTKQYDKMKKYLEYAVKKKHMLASYELAHYYDYVEIDHDKLKKYYKISAIIGYPKAMVNLALYYNWIESNYPEMKIYLLMAIELGSTDAMYELAEFYRKIEINYDLMKKFYEMATEKGCIKSMFELGYFYAVQNQLEKSRTYYDMLIEKTNTRMMFIFGCYYRDIADYVGMEKCYILVFEMINNNPKQLQHILPSNIRTILYYLQRFYKNNLKFLFILSKYTVDSDIYNLQITELLLYDKKVKMFYESKSPDELECMICYETKTHIIMPCKHSVCTECFVEILDCPIRCKCLS